MTTCKHCGRMLTEPHYQTHAEGNYRGKIRCDPEDLNLQQARVEAAMRAYRDHRGGELRGKIRATLAAADAHLPSVEQIADEIAGHPIGSGYYQTTVGVGEAREMAEAIRALFGEVAGDDTYKR